MEIMPRDFMELIKEKCIESIPTFDNKNTKVVYDPVSLKPIVLPTEIKLRTTVTQHGSSNKKMGCPFTWHIPFKLIEEFDLEELQVEKAIYLPFINVIERFMKSFIMAQKRTLVEARADFREGMRQWNDLPKTPLVEEGISPRAVEHVLKSFEYHLLKRIDNPSDSERLKLLFDEIEDEDALTSPVERGTLYGVQCIVWSTFFESGMEMAINQGHLATLWSKNCATWHFLLGKNLRRRRRHEKVLLPVADERNAFLKAYELSRNPHYGIYLAQMYRESKEKDKSREIYLNVYMSQPKCSSIQLRLALGFIRMRDFETASRCLTYCMSVVPNSSMYLHYMGIYFQKQDDLELAAHYFRMAVETGAFASILQYVEIMLQLNPRFDVVRYLEPKLHLVKDRTAKQTILLQIGLAYYYLRNNLPCSLKYFYWGIQLNPSSPQLFNLFDVIKRRTTNIISIVMNEALPYYKFRAPYSMVFSIQDMNNLESLMAQIRAKNKQKKTLSNSEYSANISSGIVRNPSHRPPGTT